MGIDYTPVLYIGKQFGDIAEAQDFLVEQGFIEDEVTVDRYGLEERLYGEDLTGTTLNCYSGYGFVIGFELGVRNPEKFKQEFELATAKWKELFPSVEPEVIHEVRVS